MVARAKEEVGSFPVGNKSNKIRYGYWCAKVRAFPSPPHSRGIFFSSKENGGVMDLTLGRPAPFTFENERLLEKSERIFAARSCASRLIGRMWQDMVSAHVIKVHGARDFQRSTINRILSRVKWQDPGKTRWAALSILPKQGNSSTILTILLSEMWAWEEGLAQTRRKNAFHLHIDTYCWGFHKSLWIGYDCPLLVFWCDLEEHIKKVFWKPKSMPVPFIFVCLYFACNSKQKTKFKLCYRLLQQQTILIIYLKDEDMIDKTANDQLNII